MVSPVLYTHLHLMLLLPEGRTGEGWEPSKKGKFFLQIGWHWKEKYFY
jgi:hypothetical protein